jgi:hypothetical protein
MPDPAGIVECSSLNASNAWMQGRIHGLPCANDAGTYFVSGRCLPADVATERRIDMVASEATTDMSLLLWGGGERRNKTKRRSGEPSPRDCRGYHFSVDQQDRLVMLYGHPLVIHVALQVAADRALSGDPVIYLDAAHTYDSLIIGRFAKARRQPPRKVLSIVHVARAYSWHQMERLVSHCLSDALTRYEARTAVIAGLFEVLAEEQASDRDIARMSDRLAESVEDLIQKGYSVLCPCPSIPMEGSVGHRLFVRLQNLADRRILAKAAQGEVTLEEEGRFEGAIVPRTAHS